VSGQVAAPGCTVGTGNGAAVVDVKGTVSGCAGLLVNKYLLPCSDESLVSVGEVCERYGCGYKQDPGNMGARFWHPDWPGDEVELVQDGRMFRVPWGSVTPSWVLSVESPVECGAARSAHAAAITASKRAGQFWSSQGSGVGPDGGEPEWYREHCARGHPHDPRCDHCARGRLRQRPAKRQGSGSRSKGAGYVLGADFTGRHAGDVDGHTVALVATVHCYDSVPEGEDEAAYGFVALLVKRDASSVAVALDQFEAELARVGRDKGRSIIRFHTDIDKSFLAKVRKQAIRKGWAQTDTGGYRSASNGIVERRIGVLKETARAMLSACSGGVNYFEQLWGRALVQANYCANRKTKAFEQLSGAPYVWEERDLVFGELVLYHVPKELKSGVYAAPGEYGVWLHRVDMASDPQTTSGDAVAPIEWDPEQAAWIVYPSVVATTCKPMGCMPLRMRPKAGQEGATFDDFVDAMFDPLLSMGVDTVPDGVVTGAGVVEEQHVTVDVVAASESSLLDAAATPFVPAGMVPEEVVDVKESGGVKLVLVKWLGKGRKHDSWVPAGAAPASLVSDFEARLAAHSAVWDVTRFARAHVVRRALWGRTWEDGGAEMQRVLGRSEQDWGSEAVKALMRKHKLKGAEEDWRTAYEQEWAKVKGMRLRELSPEEADAVRAGVLVPGLRMILQQKRDGRMKGRLVLQGFNEPYAWDGDVAVDSPVAYPTSVRMLLARGETPGGDVISKRDVSVAFLQSDSYGPEECKRYCSYRPCKGAPVAYYQLMGPLYGQRSAPRRWFKTISSWLVEEMGFEQGVNEPCLFKSGNLTVVVYVDDVLTRGDADATADFHRQFGERFTCTPEEYLSEAHPLDSLGFTVTQEVADGAVSVFMDQEESVQAFLSEFDLGELQHKQSPMPTKALYDSDPEVLSSGDQAIYRHAVGCLNYFAKSTRYDIGFAVSRLSRKMANADVGAWKALVHLLGYLAATCGFRIGGSVSVERDTFHFFVDSDHAGDRAMDCRSQTGYVIFLNSFPIDWVSRRQPVTAVSPAEAEIYAMRESVIAGRLVQWVAEEMGVQVSWPFTVQSDSTQAISFQRATAPNSKLRGCIQLRDASIKEMRDQGVVTSKHIPRDLNVADMLTHPLSASDFSRCLGRAQNLRNYSARGACLYSYVYSVSCHDF
jgi:hypothetical protein